MYRDILTETGFQEQNEFMWLPLNLIRGLDILVDPRGFRTFSFRFRLLGKSVD